MTESMVSLSSADMKLKYYWNVIMKVMNSLKLQLQHWSRLHPKPLNF